MAQQQANRVFALDIGTRTVVGVLALGSAGPSSAQRDSLNIIDMEVMEHRDRSMFDGQIHDIDQVVQTVKEVKRRLEQRNDCILEYVSVAAAGRALVTHRSKTNENVEGLGPADDMFINSLELKAMEKSQQQIKSSYSGSSRYYCVGYSVVEYYLDGAPMTSLRGHRGFEMGVQVISTFLPRTVVDSLYTVMERSGLEVINLTLEPIAAIQLAIPENLRMLNLAMVDVGAGTSDIAIARGGSISAYSMVAIAGDEVTEVIAQHLLTDFKTAEYIKIQLFSCETIMDCRDIMGSRVQVKRDELFEIIRPVVSKMSDQIAESILEYNQGPPKALFCIGGGSRTPGLKEALSSRLGIPIDRVGIKGLEDSDRLKISVSGCLGPEYITPAGIALTGHRAAEDCFIEVTVNEEPLRLLNTKSATIRDALLYIGYSPRKLIPTRGEDISVIVNGEPRVIKGRPGTAAVIRLDGQQAGLDTVLKDGSVVEIQEAIPGCTAKPTVGQIVGKQEGYIYKVNGEKAEPSHVLNDGDIVSLQRIEDTRTITILVNGRRIELPFRERPYIFVDLFNFMDLDTSRAKGRVGLKINGRKAGYTDIINEGDSIEIYWDRV